MKAYFLSQKSVFEPEMEGYNVFHSYIFHGSIRNNICQVTGETERLLTRCGTIFPSVFFANYIDLVVSSALANSLSDICKSQFKELKTEKLINLPFQKYFFDYTRFKGIRQHMSSEEFYQLPGYSSLLATQSFTYFIVDCPNLQEVDTRNLHDNVATIKITPRTSYAFECQVPLKLLSDFGIVWNRGFIITEDIFNIISIHLDKHFIFSYKLNANF